MYTAVVRTRYLREHPTKLIHQVPSPPEECNPVKFCKANKDFYITKHTSFYDIIMQFTNRFNVAVKNITETNPCGRRFERMQEPVYTKPQRQPCDDVSNTALIENNRVILELQPHSGVTICFHCLQFDADT